jgi:hypothetical protein
MSPTEPAKQNIAVSGCLMGASAQQSPRYCQHSGKILLLFWYTAQFSHQARFKAISFRSLTQWRNSN